MKKIVKLWISSSLVLKIFIGLVVGAGLGIAFPKAGGISILGSVFVGALKSIAPVLVAVLVMSAIANAKEGIGARFRTVIILISIPPPSAGGTNSNESVPTLYVLL